MKLSARGDIEPFGGAANLPEKVSRDMGYRCDSIAISRDMGTLSFQIFGLRFNPQLVSGDAVSLLWTFQKES